MFALDLSTTTVAITGGSSGIGLATAALFLRSGAAVAICGRNEARLREAEAVLRRDHADARLLAVPADVLDAAQMQAFAAAVDQTFGGADVLVNNAGEGRVSTFADTPDEAWTNELNLKFFSLIRPTRAFLPLLEKSDKAAIVCVNSLLALQPEPHMVATSAARAGAQNLIRSMATEFAPKGVRVNAILIGIVESGQWRRRFDARSDRGQSWEQWTGELAAKKGIPLGRFGKPEEAAQAILFLGTPMSSYTTGTRIDISGGNSRHL
jgi:NAD(P)-dependent dehydrogenase (short-subunit alcohol dehydrogenase family)